ncbi:hypothetical protein ABLW82_003841 [Escherichia coli]|nr:hypothetical protein [Escherichia coli]EII9938877.1 hypothetical protein [Escherichia coli]EKE4263053.1 hypothetical protein [Escherichia coli]
MDKRKTVGKKLSVEKQWVGMTGNTSIASGIDARLSDAARAPYPTYGGRRFVGMIRRACVASGNDARLSDAARAPYPTYRSGAGL